MAIPGPQGPQGPAGPKGPIGPTGIAGLPPPLAFLGVDTFSSSSAWSTTPNDGARLYRVVVVGGGGSGAGGRVGATGHNTSGASGGGGGAWEDEWYPRHELELPVRWWFRGGTDNIGLGNVLSKERTDAFSVFGWYKTNTSGTMCIIGKQVDPGGAGWRLLIGTQSQDFVMFGPSGPTRLAVNANPFPIFDGRDHFYGITKTTSPTAAGVTFYMDGVAVGKIVTEDTLAHTTLSTTPLQIGLRGSTLPMVGGIHDVSVWDRDLTALEVAEIYNAGAPPDLNAVSCAANLDLWMPLDGNDALGAGGINDHSTSNFDGTASGAVQGMHIVLVGTEVTGGLGFTGTTASASPNIAGTQGNPSSFGFLLSAYGGGGGNTNPTSAANTIGGSGGGVLSAGPSAGPNATLILGGEPSSLVGVAGLGGGGGASPTPGFFGTTDPAAARPAIRGGGPGGFGLASGAGRPGGKSRKGGGGGGPGGGSNLGQSGNAGGRSGAPSPTDVFGPYGGDGGAGGPGTIATGLVAGQDGTNGNPGNEDHAGDGGGGGGSGLGVGATGGRGADGGVPGGGGGGGGMAVYVSGAAVTSGPGGKGARGEVRVYKYG